MKAKKKKLDHVEQTVEEKLAEERKEVEEREQKVAEQEQEVAETRDNLRRLEFEFREKNAILEILLKVLYHQISVIRILSLIILQINNRVETMTLNLSNLNSSSSSMMSHLPITLTVSDPCYHHHHNPPRHIIPGFQLRRHEPVWVRDPELRRPQRGPREAQRDAGAGGKDRGQN